MTSQINVAQAPTQPELVAAIETATQKVLSTMLNLKTVFRCGVCREKGSESCIWPSTADRIGEEMGRHRKSLLPSRLGVTTMCWTPKRPT
jgi:hypothetical protein